MTKRQLVKWLEAKQSDAKAEVEIQYATAEKAYFAQRDEALKINETVDEVFRLISEADTVVSRWKEALEKVEGIYTTRGWYTSLTKKLSDLSDKENIRMYIMKDFTDDTDALRQLKAKRSETLREIEKFNNLMGDIVPPEVKKDLLEKGFFTAPASTKYHGNYEGGLFDHSYMVAHYLKKLTEECRLDWQNPRSPLLVGMFHDLCKMDNYQHPVIAETLGGEEIRDDSKWEYAMDTLLKGHGDKSVMVLAQYFKLTEEEIMCIRYHMGAFCDKSEWNDYTRAVHKYTNVLWTHQADMLASHVEGV